MKSNLGFFLLTYACSGGARRKRRSCFSPELELGAEEEASVDALTSRPRVCRGGLVRTATKKGASCFYTSTMLRKRISIDTGSSINTAAVPSPEAFYFFFYSLSGQHFFLHNFTATNWLPLAPEFAVFFAVCLSSPASSLLFSPSGLSLSPPSLARLVKAKKNTWKFFASG